MADASIRILGNSIHGMEEHKDVGCRYGASGPMAVCITSGSTPALQPGTRTPAAGRGFIGQPVPIKPASCFRAAVKKQHQVCIVSAADVQPAHRVLKSGAL